MTYFFNGKDWAGKKELELKEKVAELKKRKAIVPTLASLVVGSAAGASFYTHLKEKAAERIGGRLVPFLFESEIEAEIIKSKIRLLNEDPLFNGVMIQLPLPDKFSRAVRNRILAEIRREKDVDGLGENSLFTTPLVKAVFGVLKEAQSFYSRDLSRVVVLGSEGFEGKKIVKGLIREGYTVIGIDKGFDNWRKELKKADVLVTVTGNAGLVKPEMVKRGVILIDAGYPRGDIDVECYQKAAFVSPVPGGIGPMTIAFLLENLVEATLTQVR